MQMFYQSISALNGFWTVAQSRLQEGLQHIVAFGHQKSTVVILGMDGSFYRCLFGAATGGEMTLFEYQSCCVHVTVPFSIHCPTSVAFVFAVSIYEFAGEHGSDCKYAGCIGCWVHRSVNEK
ncbi:Autophagy-related protein 18a [Capsicum chinense]|uniref:Autophagy-related protein 18a-like n=1 Tax=Capsicum annuum TaxID=4072 RepID=A0A2G2XW02_CAPAN|nr:hypothetical protein FXO37_33904 [Capsicum annuum]KAF3623086.1 hypothetical protein FXO38_30943 [Capsicum annuum]PHT61677.1 hypothetical protein T459_34466 [Capsicum annuum]PHT98929.1 Autophagy-related protein 18a [Capsicum chinense]